jgi:hypothetical protein
VIEKGNDAKGISPVTVLTQVARWHMVRGFACCSNTIVTAGAIRSDPGVVEAGYGRES